MHEFAVPRAEALRYLGCRGDPDAVTSSIVGECSAWLLREARPKAVYRRFDLCAREEGLALGGTPFVLEGEDIRRHLRGCSACFLMAATLGSPVDRRITALQINEMPRAVALDCCATAAIEDYCDRIEAEIRAGAEREGLFLTSRFSPGYGDMPITAQKGFAAVLDTARRIGLAPTAEYILIPRKSVTAVLGLSAAPPRAPRRGCGACRLRDTCSYRKEGTYCEAAGMAGGSV